MSRPPLDEARFLRAPVPARADVELDARGKLCPLPIVALGKWLRTAPAGAVALLRADDPGFVADLLRWLRIRPVTLLALRRDGDAACAWVRNAPTSVDDSGDPR